MASQYKFRIEEKDNAFVFRFYPNNSNTQPIGESKIYKEEEECKNALAQFRTIVSQEKNIFDLMKIVADDSNNYLPRIVYEGEEIFFRTIAYVVGKYECKEWINLIKDNISAELKL